MSSGPSRTSPASRRTPRPPPESRATRTRSTAGATTRPLVTPPTPFPMAGTDCVAQGVMTHDSAYKFFCFSSGKVTDLLSNHSQYIKKTPKRRLRDISDPSSILCFRNKQTNKQNKQPCRKSPTPRSPPSSSTWYRDVCLSNGSLTTTNRKSTESSPPSRSTMPRTPPSVRPVSPPTSASRPSRRSRLASPVPSSPRASSSTSSSTPSSSRTTTLPSSTRYRDVKQLPWFLIAFFFVRPIAQVPVWRWHYRRADPALAPAVEGWQDRQRGAATFLFCFRLTSIRRPSTASRSKPTPTPPPSYMQLDPRVPCFEEELYFM